MKLELHPDIIIREQTIGAEKAPLLIIDNFVSNPDQLVAHAATKLYTATTRYFPGIRAKAPLSYRTFVIDHLQDSVMQYFRIQGKSMLFTMCHYSLVTTPPDRLVLQQRIPHIDSVGNDGLATIHYLFKANYGGTAFYRHKSTGFEYVDERRKAVYLRALETECNSHQAPDAGYIDGDTPLFERVASHRGVFNRMLIYKRNSLHSGSIGKDFVPDPDPATGRLSINSFIDVQR